MQQGISIYLLPLNTRLDVSNDETIELNMGGLKLLSLEDRTITYSNSIKFPRTPTNEGVFGFAGVVSRSTVNLNYDIRISKGLFFKTCKLKLKSFDLKNYNCELRYGSSFEILKNTKAFDFSKFITVGGGFLQPVEFPVSKTETNVYYANLITKREPTITDWFFYGSTNFMTTPSTTTESSYDISRDPKGLFINISEYLDLVIDHVGKYIDITFTTGAGSYFSNTALFCPYQKRTISDTIPASSVYTFKSYTAPQVDKSTVTVGDVLKSLSKIFFFDIVETDTAIQFNSVADLFNADGILIETLSLKPIEFTTDLAQNNRIKYNIIDTDLVGEFYASDNIVSNGDGDKVLMDVGCTIPKYLPQAAPNADVIAADLYNEKCNDVVILGIATRETTHTVSFMYGGNPSAGGGTYAVAVSDAYKLDTLDMNGYYSSVIGSTLAEPLIVNADGYLSPQNANSIIEQRVIRSVALGGKFFVEDMKYNLTTGKAVLKLIKIK